MTTPLEFTRGHALIVGVGKYQVPRLNVPQVIDDAQGVADALIDAGAYAHQHVTLVTGSQATRSALIAALKDLATKASEESVVFLFLSSHGDLGADNEYYVVTADTEFLPAGQVCPGTGLSAPELIDLLRAIPAQQLLCIINTCFSGSIGAQVSGILSGNTDDTVPEGIPLDDRLGRAIVKGSLGRVLITSSRSSQFSHYDRQSRHTYFGQALIDGLQGNGVSSREGYITLYDLYAYLYTQTKAATTQRQEPMLTVVEGVGPFPVTLHPQRHRGSSNDSIHQPPTNMAVELLGSPLDQAFADSRKHILDHVQEYWIAEVLDKGLYKLGPIQPTLVEVPNKLPQPVDMTFERYNRPPQALPPDIRMVQVFNTSGGQLLILGEPGVGKTTHMLELARDLITYARQEALAPIPIVLPLNSWAREQLPFAEWLIASLRKVYKVSPEQATEWVSHDRLVLLLDALDDVPAHARDACVVALNAFLAEHGSVRIVLCCQTEAYERLLTRPNLRNGSILIKPLSPTQVDAYLSREQLRAVREAVEHSGELRALAQLPLMLNIMCIAYASQDHVPTPADDTPEEWSRQLFNAYKRQRIGQIRGPQPYTPDQIDKWLAWLAHCLESGQQVDFYVDRLEQLQVAADDAAQQRARAFDATTIQQDWLPTQSLRRIYRGLAGFVFGCILSSVLCLVWSNRLGWIGGGLVTLGVAVFFGVLAAVLPQSSVAVSQIRIVSSDEVFGPAIHRGAWVGLVLIIVLFGIVGGLNGWLFPSLGLGCLMAAIAGGFYGMSVILAKQISQRWVSQSMHAIWRMLINVLSVLTGGIISGVIFGLLGGLLLGWLFGVPQMGALYGPLVGMVAGVVLGLMQGLDGGGQSLVNHYLLRWLLYRNGSAPWDLPGFLHYAAGLTLLYRVGDGYMFIHRRMLEHFARLYER